MGAKGSKDLFPEFENPDLVPAFKNPDVVKKVVACNTEFAFNMYQELRKSKPGNNVFFSPMSISTALAMTSMGAKGNTVKEMKDALQFCELDDKALHVAFKELNGALSGTSRAYTLDIAHRIFARKDTTFLEEFMSGTKQFYGAQAKLKDFQRKSEKSRQEINQWVEGQTNNKIKDLMPYGSVTSDTAMVLVNAIYFKGNWDKPFMKRNTGKEKFYVGEAKEPVPIKMMFLTKIFKMGLLEDLNSLVLELPFVYNELSMYILLPNEVGGLEEVEKKFTSQHLLNIAEELHNIVVRVHLPRFKLAQEFCLNGTLSDMGMKEAFIAEKADLSGIDGSRELFISIVMHKAFIEVNEEGSEAAAATTATQARLTCSTRPTRKPIIEEFRACHPFLFVIRHNASGAILFMGRMAKPDPAE